MNGVTLDRCEGCGGLVDLDDLFCPNCGREVPDRNREESPKLTLEARNFGCKNCGASMVYDPSARSLKCPFCGSVDLEADGTQGILAPDLVVPFRIEPAEAELRLHAWLGSSFWHPRDLSFSAQLTDLKAVFVPYWIFSAEVQTHWTADSNRPPTYSASGWYPISGQRSATYSDLWIPASEGLSSAELFAVGPFDPSAGINPQQAKLDGVTVEQFSLSRRYARPLAQEQLEALEATAIRDEVGGGLRNVHVNAIMKNATSRAALAPVYVMAYRYRDRLFRFVLNGQTGQATGTAPKTIGKTIGLVLFVLILIIVGVFLLRG